MTQQPIASKRVLSLMNVIPSAPVEGASAERRAGQTEPDDGAPLAVELVSALSHETDGAWIDGPDGPRALERSEPEKIKDLFARARKHLPETGTAGHGDNGGS